MRRLAPEASRTYQNKLGSGFFDKYMVGIGLDVGYKGAASDTEPILPTATGIERDYPGYDGVTLPFAEESQDYVYSSHCLEHIHSAVSVLREWYRVLKVGGFMVIVVPHKFLYEKKLNPPSRWNEDHQRFYTPASLMIQVETVFEPNSYRVRLLEDGDEGFNYDLGPDQHSDGQYEITLVIQKVKPPSWSIE